MFLLLSSTQSTNTRVERLSQPPLNVTSAVQLCCMIRGPRILRSCDLGETLESLRCREGPKIRTPPLTPTPGRKTNKPNTTPGEKTNQTTIISICWISLFWERVFARSVVQIKRRVFWKTTRTRRPPGLTQTGPSVPWVRTINRYARPVLRDCYI